MKSAYELAMERLQAKEPSVSLTEEQKDQLSEIETRYKAKIAEREIFLEKQIAEALAQENTDEVEKIRQQLIREKAVFEEEMEEEKNKIRQAGQ